MSITNRHLFKAANCFLELYNDSTITAEEKLHVADTIDSLLISIYLCINESQPLDNFKEQILKHINEHNDDAKYHG